MEEKVHDKAGLVVEAYDRRGEMYGMHLKYLARIQHLQGQIQRGWGWVAPAPLPLPLVHGLAHQQAGRFLEKERLAVQGASKLKDVIVSLCTARQERKRKSGWSCCTTARATPTLPWMKRAGGQARNKLLCVAMASGPLHR